MIYGVAYGEMKTPFRIVRMNPLLNDTDITVIQEDNLSPGDFIVATHSAIYSLSTASLEMTLIAGHNVDRGYEHTSGTLLKFDSITALIQMQSTALLVSDYNNNCLRAVSRGNVQLGFTYAGDCQSFGDVDGFPSAARFDGPYGLVDHEESIYITDSKNRKIKKLSLSSLVTSTVHKSDTHELGDFVMGSSPEEFFVTVNHGVLHILNQRETFLVGHTDTPFGPSDGQFSGVGFDGPSGITWLDNSTLLVASTYEATVRIIQINNWEVNTICMCKYM